MSHALGVSRADVPALVQVERLFLRCGQAQPAREGRLCWNRKVLYRGIMKRTGSVERAQKCIRLYTLLFYEFIRTALFFTITVHGEAVQALKEMNLQKRLKRQSGRVYYYRRQGRTASPDGGSD